MRVMAILVDPDEILSLKGEGVHWDDHDITWDKTRICPLWDHQDPADTLEPPLEPLLLQGPYYICTCLLFEADQDNDRF